MRVQCLTMFSSVFIDSYHSWVLLTTVLTDHWCVEPHTTNTNIQFK